VAQVTARVIVSLRQSLLLSLSESFRVVEVAESMWGFQALLQMQRANWATYFPVEPVIPYYPAAPPAPQAAPPAPHVAPAVVPTAEPEQEGILQALLVIGMVSYLLARR
jgi:hypothetical protein